MPKIAKKQYVIVFLIISLKKENIIYFAHGGSSERCGIAEKAAGPRDRE
jgi:hypothetical protein